MAESVNATIRGMMDTSSNNTWKHFTVQNYGAGDVKVHAGHYYSQGELHWAFVSKSAIAWGAPNRAKNVGRFSAE
jgi:hypothetical protein